MKVGVLALQGDFYLHIKRLRELGVEAIPVKTPGQLAQCNGLVIPGGESTTLVKLLKNIDLFDKIGEFNQNWPVFGTCAGAILVGKEVSNHPVEPLNLLDISVERNAYGRQIDSFIDDVELRLENGKISVEGVFIRAPRIIRVGEGVRIVGVHNGEAVLVENQSVLAATFHPELSETAVIHQYFIEKIQQRL